MFGPGVCISVCVLCICVCGLGISHVCEGPYCVYMHTLWVGSCVW